MGADDKGVVSFGKSAGKLLAQPVCFLRRNLAGNKRLAQVVGDHIVLAAHPAGLLDIPLLCKQEFRIGDPAVTLVAGDKPAVVGLFRILHIVDDVADRLAHRAALAGVQRHDSCGCHECFPPLRAKKGSSR